MRVRVFLETGDLYPGLDWHHVEQFDIRVELEEAGIPMGYGRVGRVPIQLEDVEAEAQFLNTRNVRGYDGEPEAEDD